MSFDPCLQPCQCYTCTDVELDELNNTGTVAGTNSGNAFVDLAYSIPFIASDADVYITSLVSKNLVSNFEPTYFQIPYIYSAADNLVKGKYTSSYTTDEENIITTYKIPYDGELKEETATIVTYYNTKTGIYFYEIPREFSYNSVDQASLAFIQSADGNYEGEILIPESFVKENTGDSLIKLKFSAKKNDTSVSPDTSVSSVVNTIWNIITSSVYYKIPKVKVPKIPTIPKIPISASDALQIAKLLKNAAGCESLFEGNFLGSTKCITLALALYKVITGKCPKGGETFTIPVIPGVTNKSITLNIPEDIFSDTKYIGISKPSGC